MFLHDAILEAIMCGDTSIAAPVKDAKEKVSELVKINPKTKMTGFETQYEVYTNILIQCSLLFWQFVLLRIWQSLAQRRKVLTVVLLDYQTTCARTVSPTFYPVSKSVWN